MPLQNRVDPWGKLHANPSRAATLMGNRGILHDDQQRIVKSWVGKSWVACDPGYKNIDRKPLFQAGRYSELFFLDEATAYAAGHRPCAYCQRERFNAFKTSWMDLRGERDPGTTMSIKEVDATLHSERVTRSGEKVVFTRAFQDLPDGTFFELDGAAMLVHRRGPLRWGFDGYRPAEPVSKSLVVRVLTPASIVQLFGNGLSPRVHPSAES